jgi:hypothetical protein
MSFLTDIRRTIHGSVFDNNVFVSTSTQLDTARKEIARLEEELAIDGLSRETRKELEAELVHYKRRVVAMRHAG